MYSIFIRNNTLKKSTENVGNDSQKPHSSPLDKLSSKVKAFALLFFDYLKSTIPLWSWKKNWDQNKKLLNLETDFYMKTEELGRLVTKLTGEGILGEDFKQSFNTFKNEKKSISKEFSDYVYNRGLIDYTLTALPPTSWIVKYLKNNSIEELQSKILKVEKALINLKDLKEKIDLGKTNKGLEEKGKKTMTLEEYRKYLFYSQNSPSSSTQHFYPSV